MKHAGILVRHRFRLMIICLVLTLVPLPTYGAPTPAAIVADNGCPPNRASADFVCPTPAGTGHAVIEYIYSDRLTDAIGVKLTDEGMATALTCEGAEEVADMVIELFRRIPRAERAQDDIEWARASMIDEIHAHANLGETAELLPTANPIEIDFPHYKGIFPRSLEGLTKRSEQMLFGSVWGCD